jgi:hypothetical protein
MKDEMKVLADLGRGKSGASVVDEARPLRGKLVVREVDAKTGELLSEEATENIITSAALSQVTHLLGGDTANNYVNRMQFGTGSSAPAVGNTALQQPITPLVNVTYSYPDALPSSYRVTFQGQLLSGQANGFAITEAGLVCADNTLFARRTFAEKDKTSDKILTFDWTVSAG